MVIGIDFDNTLVGQDRPYDDVSTPLKWVPGAKRGVMSLKKAGHRLVLWTARASPREAMHEVGRARYAQMMAFVGQELPGVFEDVTSDKHAIDLFIDDKALRLGPGPGGHTWTEVTHMYGEPFYGTLRHRRAAREVVEPGAEDAPWPTRRSPHRSST